MNRWKIKYNRIKVISILAIFFVIIGGTNSIKAVDDFQKYWPSQQNAKIKFIRSVSHAQQFKQKESFWGKFVNFIFGKKDAEVRLQRPWGVSAINDQLFIADPATQTVYKVDFKEDNMQKFLYASDGEFFSEGEEYFTSPIDVVADDNKIFVSDAAQQSILVFSKEGELIKQLGTDKLKRPTGLAVSNKKDWLYVVDTIKNKVYVYNTNDYELVKEFGERGGEDGELNYPVDVFVRNNKLYISDSMNFRIEIFDLDGNFITKFGHLGDGSGDFARPKGVAVDSDGHIYVVDALFGAVQIFNEKGQLLMTLGREGTNLGEFWLPTGIYIDEQDKIYVADSYNKRVQIFKYLGK
ncbi:MAG: NHL repeat protein [Candidatus Frackibacter sp. T328-2]|nr:MAG: NHL repeat protein [Candidatus Frackibacter sp. T328-2]